MLNCPGFSWSLDKVKEVHDAFLHSQGVVVVLRHLEGHEFGNFCREADEEKWCYFHFHYSAVSKCRGMSNKHGVVMTRENRSATCVRVNTLRAESYGATIYETLGLDSM
jgi:hypothetical protein